MNTEFVLNGEVRNKTGKSAARRLRNTEKVPAILYGGNQEPIQLAFSHAELIHQLENEAFYSHILTLNVDGKEHKAVLKDLQRHPSKPKVLHMDLQRVSETEKLIMHVPLHFIGEDIAPGVKVSGGNISHQMSNVEVRCLAKHLPEFIEVDLSSLGLNESIHLSDLKLPQGVELIELIHGADHDLPVASINPPRGAAVEEAGGEAEVAAPSE